MIDRPRNNSDRSLSLVVRLLALLDVVAALGAVAALWVAQSAGPLCISGQSTRDGRCAVAEPFTLVITFAVAALILLLIVALLFLRNTPLKVTTAIALVGLVVALLVVGLDLAASVTLPQLD
jgi:hypothetical protein